MKYLFQLILAMLFFVLPTEMIAGKYIKDVAIGTRSKKDDALKDLRDNGYQVLDCDLNKGCSKSSNYIYLGYTTTDDPREAITDLLVVRDNGFDVSNPFKSIQHNGKTYYPVPVPAGNDTGDLNRGGGGWDIFLWYTKDKYAEGVVANNLTWTDDDDKSGNVKFTDGKPADFNKGVPLSDDVFINYTRVIPTYSSVPIMDEMFKAENLGGQLYKFDIPIAAVVANLQTGNKETYILGYGKRLSSWPTYTYADITLSAEKAGGQKVDILSLTRVNPKNNDFTETWSINGTLPSGIECYDPATFTRMNSFNNMPITSTDNVERKWATFICKLPEDYSKFTLKATGSINYTENNINLDLSLTTLTRDVTAPEGLNNITIIDPILNMRKGNNATNLPIQPQGSQIAQVVSNNPIYRTIIWDVQNKKFFGRNDFNEALRTFSLNMDSKDYAQRYVLLAMGEYTSSMPAPGTVKAKPYVTYAAPFSVKPFHEVHDFNIKESSEIDAKGKYSQKNTLTWSIQNYRESDVMDDDQFIVQRAHKPDFSDAVTVGSKFFYDGEIDTKDEKNMILTFVDEEEAGWYDARNDSTEHKVYYRVARVIPFSLWKEDCDAKYMQKGELALKTTLQNVTGITVTKTKNFNEDKSVNLHVNLNPYSSPRLWDTNADIIIKRSSLPSEYYQGKDLAEKTIIIRGEDVKYDAQTGSWYADIEDIQSAPYTHYYYSASVDASKSPYRIIFNEASKTSAQEANACYSEAIAPFTKAEATQGTLKGKIAVEWEMDEGLVDGFELTRKEYGSSAAPKSLTLRDPMMTTYVDEDAASGKVYEYTLTAKCNVRGNVYTSSKTIYGWNSYYGTLSGKVLMPNGAHVTGPVTVKVKAKDGKRVTINECKIDTNIIMPGYDNVYESSITTTDGTFSFDEIPYIAQGIDYEVNIDAYHSDVEYAGQKGKTFAVRLNDAQYEPEMNLLIADTKRFSGRVLYDNSTIPVNEVVFYLNGYPLLDANGDAVKTDNKGNFSFVLPSVDLTLQARKEGHTIDNEGYIEGTANDVTSGDHHMLPSQDYDGLILYDKTKVRLAGRLIGGNTQGKLPVGLGVSKNNLGDDLKLVLELEGDNTSSILYLKDQPDVTSQKHSYSQTVTSTERGAMEVNKTDVTVEKKRIVILPDVKTGEFCLDIAPAKYKITEMSAKGYPTLFTESQGFEVLDLTNDVTTLEANYTDDTNDETLTTSYNSRYQKIYHNPVSVTYTQNKYGIEQKILGADKISEYNLKGERVEATVAKYDKTTGKVTYTFGYPVFEEGKDYQLIVSAHEDYYYNGDHTSVPDVVNLEAGKLKVRNGLESSVSEQEYELNSKGTALIDVVAGNTNFSLTDNDALRSLTMQVLSDGYYYEAEPLRAYVTGSRDKGTDVMTLDGEVTVLDIIRDPYGSQSYAYRDRGARYNWQRTLSWDFNSSTSLTFQFGNYAETLVGVWSGVGGGAFAGSSVEGVSISTNTIPVPLYSGSILRSANYTLQLDDRISTSSDPADVGAMADVYLGAVNTIDVGRREVFCVIDQTTYNMAKPAIDAKAIRIVSEGRDAEGKPFYLAIAEKLNPMLGKPRQFVYTQKYIVSTLIPNLVQQYKSLIRIGSKEEVQAVANSSHTVQYRLKDGKTFEDEDCYETITPNNPNGLINIPRITPENCKHMIKQWAEAVSANEEKKIEATKSSNVFTNYSLSAGNSVSHSEYAEWYDVSARVNKLANVDLNEGELSGSLGIDLSANPIYKEDGNFNNDEATKGKGKNGNGDEVEVSYNAPGTTFRFFMGFAVNAAATNVKDGSAFNTAGSGYVLATNDDSYLDMDVYSVAAPLDETGFNENSWDFVGASDSKEIGEPHDYVFVVRGGAERQPWYAPDSTLYCERGTALGTRTMKIDNPKIYIDQPTVSNLPSTEKAYFSVRLTNDTELPASTKFENYNPSTFYLTLDDKSTADGAIITMDGMPLISGLSFTIAPGQSITKTIQVERSGKTYDYNDLQLVFSDAGGSLADYSTISIHYLPTSTPVKIIRPVDKWVMNTLSPVDDEGKYYLPIEVTGFDVNFDNFDHIELQYKKQSEGDSKWVNLCSYYADQTLFDQASGAKGMITNGTISHRFYGDADPMEMAYDIRAVSFSRHGSGFVSSVSNVMSGQKDTRCPEIFGVPKPTNGVLTFQDVISIPFNEPIAYNYLDETANFSVTSIVNGADASYNTSLRFPKPTMEELYEVPITKVERNLSGSDFTWEGMVKLNGDQELANFMLIGDNNIETYTKESYFLFTLENDILWAGTNGVLYGSANLKSPEYESLYKSLHQKLTHVAVTFKQGDDVTTAGEQTQFYIDGVEIPLAYVISEDEQTDFGPDYDKFACNAQGKVSMGYFMDGNMADVRLWNKALSVSEMNGYRGKTLSGQEASLLGYWPMDELQGNVLHDKANGADMEFSRQEWQQLTGQHSLRIEGNAFMLQNTEKFLRYDNNDYTLMSWFAVDKDKTVADSVAIFQSGSSFDSEKLTVYLSKENMAISSGSHSYNIATRQQVMDGQWHNFAVVANKSLNSVALYFDGLLTNTISGSEFGGMQQAIQLGSKEFYGNIDNLSFWHLAYPANSIDRLCNFSPNGDEMGLVYYLPFERDAINSQNMHETVFSTYNEVINMTADNKPGAKKQAFEAKVLNDAALLATMDDADRYSPAKPKNGVVNLPFSWTATNNELQINILETDSKINHQYVTVTVRGVEDLAGNPLVNPQMMMVYVDHNVLTWDADKVDLNLPYGEKETVVANLSNKSGRTVNYKIEENCSWLTPSKRFGTASPLSTDNVEFEISDGLAPGDYSATVYLVDEDNLSSHITVNVTVTADEPQWEVTTDASYQYTMNLRGQVMLKNGGGVQFINMDKRDIVAAFYEGVCVGKTYISVDNDKNTSIVNMTIYGNDAMKSAIVNGVRRDHYLTFQLWRASTNEVCMLQPNTDDNKIAFAINSMVGCPPESPVIFTPDNAVKQTITLEKGWNWISLNIIPKKQNGLNGLFDSNNVFTPGDLIMNGDAASELIFNVSELRTSWSGNEASFHNLKKYTYQVYVQNPTKATVFGYQYDDANRFVTLSGSPASSSTWCDLAYLLNIDQPINIAMSDYSRDRAKVGTIIKSHKRFAVMDEDGKWVGSLEYMRPGEGYYLKYFGSDSTTVKYTNTTKTAKSPKFVADLTDEDLQLDDDNSVNSEAKDMMPIIADVKTAVEFCEGDEVVAFCKSGKAGSVTATELDDSRQLFFISVNANDGDAIRFAHVRDGKIIGMSRSSITFDANDVTGTLKVPYTIDFTASDNADDSIFGIGGEKYEKASDIVSRRGVFIVNGKKVVNTK